VDGSGNVVVTGQYYGYRELRWRELHVSAGSYDDLLCESTTRAECTVEPALSGVQAL
jgi:hypothetical protein